MAAKIIIGTILTAAVLAGCSSAASLTSAAPPTKTATTSTLACKQVYLAWKNGPAKSAAGQFTAAQTALSAAGSKENNVAGITAAVEAEGQAAASLGAFPVPACADPSGYLAAVLANVRTAAANAATANGLSELVTALAPLNAVPGLESDFTAELKRTTGI
jgi:hypothetical protein